MTFQSARQALLLQPLVPSGLLPDIETEALDRQIAEILVAQQHSLWKSVTFLASQIIEALLRRRLAGEATVTVPPNAGMAQLVLLAKSADILPSELPLSSVGSISAALVIRNWAAHFDLLASYPDERRATQAIALMVCAAEILFPSQPADETDDFLTQDILSWREYAPGTVLRRVRHDSTLYGSQQVREQMPAILNYVAAGTSLKSLYGMWALIELYDLSWDLLASTLQTNYGFLVRHSWFASDKTIRHCIATLRKLGLRDHAAVLSILLPLDEGVFQYLIHAQPTYASFYLRDCLKADPDLYEWKMSKIVNKTAALNQFWEVMEQRDIGLREVGAIVVQNPDNLRARFIAAAPLKFLEKLVWNGDLRTAMYLFRCVRSRIVDQNSELEGVRDCLIDVAIENITDSTLQSSRDIILMFYEFKMADDPICIALTKELLHRIVETPSWENLEWRAARRMAWEAYAYVPACRDLAVVAADSLLATVPAGLSAWDFATIVGLLHFAGKQPDLGAARRRIIAPVVGGGWYNFLVLLAIRSFPLKLSEGAPKAFALASAEYLEQSHDINDVLQRLIDAVADAPET